MHTDNKNPNFLFIGPDKTGSSWLYEVLSQHPHCFVPQAKDIYFFDRYYQYGWPWYSTHFADAPATCSVIGELSHDYILSTQAARRIAADLPGVKLVTFLRDPVERTFSHYLYMIRSGRTRMPFEKALETFPELINNSLYGQHLSVYFDLFESRKIGVFFFDDLVASPAGLGRKVLSFLDLPVPEEINFDLHVRPASRPKNYVMARLGKKAANVVRDLGFPNVVGAVKNSRLVQKLYVPYGPDEKPSMLLSTREALNARFADDLVILSSLIGTNGPAWLSYQESGLAVNSAPPRLKSGNRT